MDFQSAMETFAEAWAAANAGAQTQALALTRPKTPKKELSLSPASSIETRVGGGGGGSDLNESSINRRSSPSPPLPLPPTTSLQPPSHSSTTTTSTPTTPVDTRPNSISCTNNNNNNINNNNNNNNNSSSHINNNSSNNNNQSQNNVSSDNHNNTSSLHHQLQQQYHHHHQQQQQQQHHHAHHTNLSSAANLSSNLAKFNSNSVAGIVTGGNSSSGPGGCLKFENGVNISSGRRSESVDGGLLNSVTSSSGGGGGGNIGHLDNGIDKILTSPSMERKEFDFTKVNSKSLPLHCVVESFTSLQASLSNDTRSPWKRRSNIETDSYVIIPSATPFCDIVKTALQSLGYSLDIANTAKGMIIIKNWKPLALEKITDSPLISVGEILGELTSIITLRISVLRTKPTSLNEIKDKLLKLLILQSHAVLRSSGCPLDEIVLSQICRSNLPNTFPFEISDDMRRKFDQWWSNQLTPQANPIANKILPAFNINPAAVAQNEIDFAARHLHNSRENIENHLSGHHHNMIVHPALQTVHSQYPSQKTRMRTSFDPEMELPKLQKWFQENPHPSRQQIQSYVIQLNALESRRGRKPLDVNNVVYWFKNARAAQKRAELRGHSLGNGYSNQSGMMMSHSDYMKSPPSEDIDNLSQHSDDMDDEIERALSPQVPLSLTTHERNRSPINVDDIKNESDRSPPSSPITTPNNNNNNGSGVTIKSDHLSIRANNDSPKTSPTSEELDMDDSEIISNDFRSPSPDSRREMPFSFVPNSMLSHSIMYMSHYIPTAMGQGHHSTPSSPGAGGLNLSGLSNDERRKRNRTFIDPVTEVPKLEQWFAMNTHPSHNLILKYTEDLNRMPYRQKFPRLESKNVQFWFKNRRAKCKRLKMSLYDPSHLSGLSSFSQSSRE